MGFHNEKEVECHGIATSVSSGPPICFEVNTYAKAM